MRVWRMPITLRTRLVQPPADGLKCNLAHIFIIGFAFANGMLAEFQMRRNLPILEQGEAHSSAHCQNAFETAAGNNPEALDAGIIEHANWFVQCFREDCTKLETMPRFGTEIGSRQNGIRPHHAW